MSQTRQDSASALVERAYKLINEQAPGAIQLLEEAISIDSMNVPARRQLGYLYLANYNKDRALLEFQKAQRILPSDSIGLQVAYLLQATGKAGEARIVFEGLRNSTIGWIRKQIEDQLEVMTLPAEEKCWWFRIYADPYYDTRWESTFYHGFLQNGYYLNESRELSLYGLAAVSGDSKSQGGTAPVLFADNSLMVAVGLRFQPWAALMVDVQEGAAWSTLKGPDQFQPVNDFRAIATLAHGGYAEYFYHPRPDFPLRPWWDIFASAGYYSRYKDGIGYAQLRGGLRALEVSHTVADLYFVGQLVMDTEHWFYNNIAEEGVGLRVTPDVRLGLHFVAELRNGNYLNVNESTRLDREAFYGQSYTSGRFMIIFDQTF